MPVCSAGGASFSASRTWLNTVSSWSWKSCAARLASSSEMSPRPMRASVYCSREVGSSLMMSYISGWVIGLVVAATAVAHQVDEDILAETVTVIDRQLCHPDDSLRVVAVDVEDRGVEALGQVGGVVGRTAGVRGRREADLVVHDDVDG